MADYHSVEDLELSRSAGGSRFASYTARDVAGWPKYLNDVGGSPTGWVIRRVMLLWNSVKREFTV